MHQVTVSYSSIGCSNIVYIMLCWHILLEIKYQTKINIKKWYHQA